MEKITPHDPSHGYEEAAERYMASRNQDMGVAIVREWSRTLAPGSPDPRAFFRHAGRPTDAVLLP